MPNLYIISGCNGAGKTTASFTVLPEMLNCREFVNVDNFSAVSDYWLIINSSDSDLQFIAEGNLNKEITIFEKDIWQNLI
ncbi:hypothetical protein [Pedobacter nototheniae]|uniref:hypothetical protein n=1 Tax=Pedobacter nototheniae TaxID=2488994 RepID=UPI001FE86022|nr:hypothetical protein [Pedobacter nototheniae]